MHYLTVQDILWIHLQIAKKQESFSFAQLEEATNYQYSYGKSKDVLGQAARLLGNFATKAPFGSANKAVALVAGIAFLELNGYELHSKEKDLVGWLDKCADKATALQTVTASVSKTTHEHEATTREIAKEILNHHASTIKKLMS